MRRERGAADVEQHLARLLVHLLDRFGDDLEGGSALLPLDLQRRQLAELVGARVETVIRAMRRWAAEGLVTSAKGRLCVANPSALAAMAPRINDRVARRLAGADPLAIQAPSNESRGAGAPSVPLRATQRSIPDPLVAVFAPGRNVDRRIPNAGRE